MLCVKQNKPGQKGREEAAKMCRTGHIHTRFRAVAVLTRKPLEALGDFYRRSISSRFGRADFDNFKSGVAREDLAAYNVLL